MKICFARQSVCSLVILLIFTNFFHSSTGFCQVQLLAPKIQDSLPYVIIHKISIDGNKITRASIISRELRVHEYDTIPLVNLSELLQSSRENVFNTTLFNFVTVDTSHLKNDQGKVDIRIHVIERWYIWPWPYFVISDRDFNSWLETTDFSKVTYGINMTFFNMRGRNETLVFPLHFGFNQRFGIAYRILYINNKKTIGMGFGANYDRNHEVVVQSVNNKPVYYKDPQNYPMQTGNTFLEFFLRPNFYSKHTFRLEYNQVYFSDSLVTTSDFSFDNKTNRFHYFSFSYQYKNDHRDIQFYPLQGYYFDVTFAQNGLFEKDVNLFSIKSVFRKYWQLYNRWYFASGIQGKFSLPGNKSYFLQRGLGYGRDYIRGYEYYVIDGQSFLLLKNNIKFAIIPQHVAVLDILKSIKFNTIPYALYMNVFADFGYVYNDDKIQNEGNNLQNQLLTGYGIGLDFTTYYDIVIRVECSINGEGSPGLYLHFIAPI